ncbi:cell wall-binding repeat-containing protein [Clostridium sp.]|uniref:cell wall-binding repeat-containing protein n=1 Tax=Clostridium sp. TaxID=1506 RepID=UPI003D6D2652
MSAVFYSPWVTGTCKMLYSIDYIKDHLKKDGTIYILGGIGVVSNDFVNQFNTLGFKNIIRLGGIDRFDTNKKIIDQLASSKGTPIIIANGYDFADALSVSSIAAIKGYPIFMSNTKSIPESIKSKISELQPSKVYILGGIGALTEDIKDQVKSLTSLTDADILRIGGANRYETSLNICNTFKLNTDTIVIANGEQFPDALSGSALAAKRNSPIILTNGKDIAKQKEYIDKSDCTKIILLGGTAAIGKSVEDKFDKVVGNTEPSQGGGSTNPTTDNTNIVLKAKRTFGIPELQWNAIEGASYQVKRGEDKEKLEIVAENITENNFTDVNSTTEKQYFYSVTAKKSGKDLYTSNLVLIKAFIDSDKDGLSDEQEVIYKTEPNNPDTDGDKLTDGLEVLSFYTNPLIKDTDGDRLSDYEEATITVTNPVKKDTDGNGITDDLEDIDKDTLNNYDEMQLASNPNLDDSDFDGLKDADEKQRGTNPNNIDTDEDGLSDFKEVELGTNPLIKDTDGDGILDGDEVFKTKLSAEGVNVDDKVKPTLELDLKGSQIGTLKIDIIDKSDLFLSSDIPGYIGSAYEFAVDGTFTTSKLTFEFDSALSATTGFTPRIYYFNEELQMLEELENQTVIGNTVSADLTHFSKYILLNKIEFDKVWEEKIKPPTEEGTQADSLDIALVLDSSGSMVDNDYKDIRLDVAKAFVDKLTDKDRAAIVDFDYSAILLSAFTSDKEVTHTSQEKNACNPLCINTCVA